MPTKVAILKSSVEPASLAGAAIYAGSRGGIEIHVPGGGVQAITADVLHQLDLRGVLDWLPGGQEAAGGSPAWAAVASPMLDPGIPPAFTEIPERSEGSSLAWAMATYAVAVAATPVTTFFAYATLSEDAMSATEALASFGPSGWILSVMAGLGIGYAVSALTKDRLPKDARKTKGLTTA